MKIMQTLLLGACAAMLFSSCGASYQTKRSAEKEAERAANVQAIMEPDFILDINQIIPFGFPSRSSTGEYALRLEGNVVTTRLPFIGVAYDVQYPGTDEMSIVFEKESVQLSKDFSKASKGEYTYMFTGGKGQEKWTVTLHLYDSGSATIFCAGSHGRQMNYFATLNIPDKNAAQ